MTRMWVVNPKILCRNHLLGEHKEIHQLVGHISKGNWHIIEGHLKAKPPQIQMDILYERHEELVEEMSDRGYNHNSPFGLYHYDRKYEKYKINVDANLKDLLKRCPKCRQKWMDNSKKGD